VFTVLDGLVTIYQKIGCRRWARAQRRSAKALTTLGWSAWLMRTDSCTPWDKYPVCGGAPGVFRSLTSRGNAKSSGRGRGRTVYPSPPATATTQPCAVMDAATACSAPVLLARRAGLLPAQVDPVAVELHPLVAVRACWSRRGDGAEQGRFRPQS